MIEKEVQNIDLIREDVTPLAQKRNRLRCDQPLMECRGIPRKARSLPSTSPHLAHISFPIFTQ
jgi:hypothetical protein